MADTLKRQVLRALQDAVRVHACLRQGCAGKSPAHRALGRRVQARLTVPLLLPPAAARDSALDLCRACRNMLGLPTVLCTLAARCPPVHLPLGL